MESKSNNFGNNMNNKEEYTFDEEVYNPDMKNVSGGPHLYIINPANNTASLRTLDTKDLLFAKTAVPRTVKSCYVDVAVKNPFTGQYGPLLIQTPLMPTSFGFGANAYKSESVNINFRDMQKLKTQPNNAHVLEVDSFFKTIKLLDMAVLDAARQNVRTWFVESKLHNCSPETLKTLLDERYSAMTAITEGKAGKSYGKKFAPSIRIKAEKNRRGYTFCVFDKNTHDKLTPHDILPRSDIVVIMQCGGIWFREKQFGLDWKLVQVLVDQEKQKGPLLPTFAMASSDSADMEMDQNAYGSATSPMFQEPVFKLPSGVMTPMDSGFTLPSGTVKLTGMK